MRPRPLVLALVLAPILILAGALLAATPAPARQPPATRDFTVVNDTELELAYLYIITPTGGWPSDILGEAVVAPGATLNLDLEGEACRYDIRAVFTGGAEVRRQEFDVCAHPEIRLAAELAAAPGAELIVLNDAAAPVTEVRARKPDGPWSGNLLDRDEQIEAGEGRRFDLGPRGLGCEVELRLRVAGRPAPVEGAQDLCASAEFSLAFALGLDTPGMGRGGVAIRAETGEAPATSMAPAPPAPGADLGRGLPICPGDPRCKKKK